MDESAPPPVAPRPVADVASLPLFEARLGVWLTFSGAAFYELYKAHLAPIGLRPSWVTALATIAARPHITQSALGRRLAINRASAMALSLAMEGAGLVARNPLPGRNQTALTLTEHGAALLDRGCAIEAALTEAVTQDFSEAERATLLKALRRISDAVARMPHPDRTPPPGTHPRP